MVGIRTLLLLLLALLPVWACQAAAEEASADESALLKAAYIYNFAKFTRWEVEEGDTLHLCALGSNGLSEALQRLAGKWVGERRIAVHKFLAQAPSEECHILYFGASQSTTYRTQLQGIATQPLLTISEIPDFAVSGGMIELFEERGQIRFRVNLEAVEAGDLTLSSRLLSLAEIVAGQAR